MDYFSEIQSRLKLTKDAIYNSVDFVGDALVSQKRAELRAGVNADGNSISPAYSFDYGKYKDTLSGYYAPSGTPDLYVSGNFHSKIGYTKKGFKWYLKVNSPEPYMKELEKIYNEPRNITEKGEIGIATRVYNNITKEWAKIW